MHQGPFSTVIIEAGADLSAVQHKAIVVAGTIAATSETAIGLLQNKPEDNRAATVGWHGQMKAYAGAAISVGAVLMVTTSGFIITATSAGNCIGQALVAANSGDLFPGLFNFLGADA